MKARDLLLVIALLTAAPSAMACSCVYPAGSQNDHIRREFQQSEAVFSAYVHTIYFSDVNGRPTRMAKMRILQVWKGSLNPNTWVDVVSGDTDLVGCGYEAEADTALMVYASGAPPFTLRSCSLTGPLAGATTDIPLLNKLAARQAGK